MVSDGTETQADVTLSAEETETSEKPTITQAQLEEAKRQAASDALSDSGRLQREAENALKLLTGANERTKARLKELEDAELEAAQGSSEQRSEQEAKERRKRRQVETELDEATLKLNQRDEELSQFKADSEKATKGDKAKEIATRLGVDADRLIKLSKFTDGSVEAMEELAKELPKKEVRPPVQSDSGGGGGSGGGTFTRQQIADMPIDEYEKNKADIDKAQAAGKIK